MYRFASITDQWLSVSLDIQSKALHKSEQNDQINTLDLKCCSKNTFNIQTYISDYKAHTMKIGLMLPHSLTLSLTATATALSDQNVTLNDFVILCEIEDGCETLDINF